MVYPLAHIGKRVERHCSRALALAQGARRAGLATRLVVGSDWEEEGCALKKGERERERKAREGGKEERGEGGKATKTGNATFEAGSSCRREGRRGRLDCRREVSRILVWGTVQIQCLCLHLATSESLSVLLVLAGLLTLQVLLSRASRVVE